MQIINSIIQFIMDLGGAIFLPFMITILACFSKSNFSILSEMVCVPALDFWELQ